VKNRGAALDDEGDEHPGLLSVGRRSRTIGRRVVAPWRGEGILSHHLPNSPAVRGVPGRSGRRAAQAPADPQRGRTSVWSGVDRRERGDATEPRGRIDRTLG
jgi:hypothetical protein